MLSMIAAISKNLVIGRHNALVFNIPEDMLHFKTLTTGKKIIMGRKTFNSLPNLLPNRHHIILTKNEEFKYNNDSVEVYTDFSKLVDLYKNSKEEVFVIGGGEIYELFMPYANKLYITEINKSIEGDTNFPKISLTDWTLISEELHKQSIPYYLTYSFKNYKRKNPKD